VTDLLFAPAYATLPPPGIGPGAAGWTTFLEPGLAAGLAITGNEAWIATNTGLRAYDTSTGTWASYYRANGLPSDAVAAVATDASGRVWVGTGGSDLARVERDGSITAVPGALLGINAIGGVTTLAPVGDSLWIGAANGIALLRVSRLSSVGLGSVPSAARRVVRDILVDGADAYVATDSTIARFSDGAWSDLRDGVATPALALARALGAVYVATASGVYRRAESGWTQEANNASMLGTIRSIAGSANRLVAATSTGVWTLDATGGPWSSLELPSGVSAHVVGLTDGGAVWAGTADGVAGRCVDACAGSTDWTIARAPGAASLSVRDPSGPRIAFDADGGVWITTQRGGVAYYDGTRWRNYGAADGLLDDGFWFAAFIGRSGERWFANWGEGLARITGQGSAPLFEVLRPGTGLSGAFAMGLDQDAAGRLWVGHDNHPLTGETYGVDVLDTNGTWSNVAVGDPRYALTSNRVWTVRFDRSGRAWLGEKSGGVDVWNSRNFTSASPSDWFNIGPSRGLPSPDVYEIAFRDVDAWIATSGGLARVNTSTLAVTDVYTVFDGLPSSDVRSLAIDGGQRLWVGTAEGLAQLRGDGSFETFTTSNSGLVSNRVYSVGWNAARSELWVATADGVSRYAPGSGSGPGPGPGTVVVTAGPNPLRRGSGARIALRGYSGSATATIYTIDGREVRRVTGVEESDAFWDGTDASGAMMPPGVYLVHVEGASFESRVAVTIGP
jgi:ligand-binding sensor domain-containing protein